jgi:capsid protein
MTKKYEIHNQLTGLLEEAQTFEEAKVLQARIKAEYLATLENLFNISVLVQNEDESWTQSVADENGYPIVFQIEELE